MAQLLTHIVQRSFGDDTINRIDPLQQRMAGECVNALMWRNIEGLEKSRRIVPMPEGLEPISDSFGRFWIDIPMLKNAGRELLDIEAKRGSVEPVEVVGSDDLSWLEDIDPDAEDLDWNALIEHGFAMPARMEGGSYQLWNGQVVVGSLMEAAEEHYAGVRARIRELRAEHLVPAAGSVTEA